MELVRTSYKKEDVTILLSDITGLVEPLPTPEREKRIQSGTHYCEMLPIEYVPSDDYISLYELALEKFSDTTAQAVMVVAEKIYAENPAPVLVSLARAGLPAGILIKHYLERKYNIEVPHFSISIIRGRGIDKNAMNHILGLYDAKRLQFVDGWTGKGAIRDQLEKALSDFPAVSKKLAVIADPACITDLCGTHKDFLIASSCLNSVVSGLVSRSFLRSDIIGENDFHGAVYYGELSECDRSYEFIESVEKYFELDKSIDTDIDTPTTMGIDEVRGIKEHFGISDINFVKPGIGETTRVLLRRVPYKVLIAEGCEMKYVEHIITLAKEKNVPVEYYPLRNYRCCGIIKNMPSDA